LQSFIYGTEPTSDSVSARLQIAPFSPNFQPGFGFPFTSGPVSA
jgi:hypothetical protein